MLNIVGRISLRLIFIAVVQRLIFKLIHWREPYGLGPQRIQGSRIVLLHLKFHLYGRILVSNIVPLSCLNPG